MALQIRCVKLRRSLEKSTAFHDVRGKQAPPTVPIFGKGGD
jgi:hypothetical protein